jgi:hypothetical protein
MNAIRATRKGQPAAAGGHLAFLCEGNDTFRVMAAVEVLVARAFPRPASVGVATRD